MPRSVSIRPPWLAATCLLGATMLLVPPKHGFEELAPMGRRPTVVVEGERFGELIAPPRDVDPWMVITPGAVDVGMIHMPNWYGDPHIFLTAPPIHHTPLGLDDLLSGLWKLVAPVPG